MKKKNLADYFSFDPTFLAMSGKLNPIYTKSTGCPSAKADVSIGPDREKYLVPRQSSKLFMVLNSGNFC